jgi:hypothetical protein
VRQNESLSSKDIPAEAELSGRMDLTVLLIGREEREGVSGFRRVGIGCVKTRSGSEEFLQVAEDCAKVARVQRNTPRG